MRKVEYIERVLITLHPDGTMRDAAAYRLSRFLDDDGEPFAPDREGDAEPLTADTLAAALPGHAALMSQLATALDRAENEAFTADGLARRLADTDLELAGARVSLGKQAEALREAEARVASLTAELELALASVQRRQPE